MKIVLGLLGLSFLVFFHELGHFLIASAMGVTVEAFSIGMGPVLLHHKWGKTDYRISLIPIGGYCSMKGEKDYQNALETNQKEIHGEKDSFYGVHPFKRLLIAFAGPFFNVIFAFIAFTIIALMGYTYTTAGNRVLMTSDVEEYKDSPSPASEAGMKSGDIIVSMDGNEVNDFTEIRQYIAMHGGETVRVKVLRNEQYLEIDVPLGLDKSTGSGFMGIVLDKDSVIQKNYGPYSFFPALAQGVKKSVNTIGIVIKSVGILFKGVNLTSAVSGPVRTTVIIGDMISTGFEEGARIGIINTLEFLAFISISLFLTNLLPIPILDGGLILFAFIECITRRKMNPKLLYYIQMVGLIMVVCISALAIVGDIVYFIK
ncbi:MAG: site-2 protease family protein [Treponema sp.]|nr:site-2 protease family protein [Treponema sp.]